MAAKLANKNVLRTFTPLNALGPENLMEILAKAVVGEMPAGHYLFKEGDVDKHVVYILQGTVELLADSQAVGAITGGTAEARHPLAPEQPRRYSARAKTAVQYVRIDRDLLDIMLTWDQSVTYEVDELLIEEGEQTGDWMTRILQTKAFYRIPPANIQAMFLRMEPTRYMAGEIVVKQGDEGDYFYIIKQGRCQVIRETTRHPEGVVLAELSTGDSFGEEALISESRRNATVKMVTDGVLMRLAKSDFLTLLNEPLLDWVTYEQATAMAKEGAVWLDVRLPSEYDKKHLPGARNIPLYFLRNKLRELDPNGRYIVYCDTGRRSSAAAYLLNERGYNACALKEGLAGARLVQAA